MKMTRNLLLLTLGATCLGACNANVKPPEDIKKKADLYYAYSHENLLSSVDYLTHKDFKDLYKNRDYKLRFECIRGEYDSAQLIMHAFDNISSFDFTLEGSLVDGRGNSIPEENIEVYVAWYQYVASTNEKSKAMQGYYPDALIPIENYKARKKDFVDKGRNQAIFVRIKVPENTEPGVYSGNATLTTDKYETSIPLEATIHRSLMPTENHYKSSYLIWYEQIGFGEKENDSLEMKEKYYEFALEHRMTPDRMPDYYEANSRFATTMVDVAKDERISAYRFPISGSNEDLTKFSEKVDFYMNLLYERNLTYLEMGEDIDLFKKMYFYVDDEPKASKYDLVRNHDKIIYEAKVKYAQKFVEDGYPQYAQSVMGINNIVTVAFSESMIATEEVGGVQCWCPQFQNFDTQAERDNYKERQESTDRPGGESVWWYGCYDPQMPFPSYHLNAPTLYSRVLPYMQHAYGIEGMVYWNLCWYSKQLNNSSQSRDIWYDPITWENCAGDGALYYPGYEYNVNGPISTLRLENILQGIEEYEYLYLLKQYVDEYNEQFSASKDLEACLANEYTKIFTGATPIVDVNAVEKIRKVLLTALDKFDEDLEIGMSYLESLGE